METITVKEFKKKARPREASIHVALCDYVRAKYPDVIFTSESSGIRLTMGQAVKAKRLRSSSKLPDFWMAEPAGLYHGLFLELKRSRDEVYLKGSQDGPTYRNDKHIQGQRKVLDALRAKGYMAVFACGLEDAKEWVDFYLIDRRIAKLKQTESRP